MKHREKLFKLLRECVETPQESFAVEEMIRKVKGDMLPIETVSDTRTKCNGFTFHKNNHGRFVGSIGLHRFVWTYFNGEIPDGYDVHHLDFNHDNNDIANLELVTKDEHKRIHAAIKSTRKPGKKSTFTCAVCGKEFQAAIAATTLIVRRRAKKLPNVPASSKLKRAKSAANSFRQATTQDFVRANVLAKLSSGRKSKLVPSAEKFFRMS
ncbi:MAG: HNH endonuclease [Selenomonadaceae bacterium]|nr:HNH endonuclease [Selenomonadaceae bacterium]